MHDLLVNIIELVSVDADGDVVAEVLAVHYVNGKLGVTVAIFEEDDDGEEEPIPEPVVHNVVNLVAEKGILSG